MDGSTSKFVVQLLTEAGAPDGSPMFLPGVTQFSVGRDYATSSNLVSVWREVSGRVDAGPWYRGAIDLECRPSLALVSMIRTLMGYYGSTSVTGGTAHKFGSPRLKAVRSVDLYVRSGTNYWTVYRKVVLRNLRITTTAVGQVRLSAELAMTSAEDGVVPSTDPAPIEVPCLAGSKAVVSIDGSAVNDMAEVSVVVERSVRAVFGDGMKVSRFVPDGPFRVSGSVTRFGRGVTMLNDGSGEAWEITINSGVPGVTIRAPTMATSGGSLRMSEGPLSAVAGLEAGVAAEDPTGYQTILEMRVL